MEKIVLNDNNYEIIKNYKNGYDKDVLTQKYTDFFKNYDYIVGDWSYGKIRLKGFYESTNKNCKDFNNIEQLEKYLKENCSFECAYFVAKKI